MEQNALKRLYQRLEDDAGVLPLCSTKKDIVPGEGAVPAAILFIGEAPGYHESVERRPFVGRSGKFLRATIAEIGLQEEQYYISNIVKARPPDNRDPLPQELAAYKPYLDEEIAIINPELIVTLGRFSMAKFLPEVKISQVHGRLHRSNWGERTDYILPMYHPAAGLRSTKVKESFVTDMEKIPKILAWVREKQETHKLQQNVTQALF